MFKYSEKTIADKPFKLTDQFKLMKANKEIKQDAVNIENIMLTNVLSPASTNLTPSDNVKEIYIIQLDLKNKTTPEKFIEAFNKQINFQVLFKFCSGAEVKYLTAIKTFGENMKILKTYQTEWQQPLSLDFPLTTKLETVYKAILSNITGIVFRADETFELYIERNSAIKRQNLEIDRLTRIMTAEKQPNIKMNINDKIKQLKKNLEEMR